MASVKNSFSLLLGGGEQAAAPSGGAGKNKKRSKKKAGGAGNAEAGSATQQQQAAPPPREEPQLQTLAEAAAGLEAAAVAAQIGERGALAQEWADQVRRAGGGRVVDHFAPAAAALQHPVAAVDRPVSHPSHPLLLQVVRGDAVFADGSQLADFKQVGSTALRLGACQSTGPACCSPSSWFASMLMPVPGGAWRAGVRPTRPGKHRLVATLRGPPPACCGVCVPSSHLPAPAPLPPPSRPRRSC